MPSKILNFSSDRLITGINIIEDTLFFTDNENEPKKILLKEFREADHSTGTTNVYGSGRQFQERDITVIRPHPLAPPSISTASGLYDRIDNYINSHAGRPQVITGGANPHESGAVIYGQSISNGSAFQERGFYYVEYSGDITRSYVLEEGEKIKVNYLDGINFKAELDDLNDGKKHYYIAYAKTAINEVVFADNIKSFISGGAVGVAATVTTFNPLRTDENLKYFLEGEVISNTPVQESGFWYRQTELAEGASLTDLENDEYRKTVPSDYLDVGSGRFNSNVLLEAGKTIFVQAWARNDSGLSKGSVTSPFTVRDARGPSVENSKVSKTPNSAEVSGRVTSSNGDLKSRGFYFSKYYTNKFDILSNEDSNLVYKVTVPFDEYNENSLFKYDTATDSNFPFQFSVGDNLYFLAFADNGTENQAAGVTAVNFESVLSGEISGDPPKVETLDLFPLGDGRLQVNYKLHNIVSSSGVIIVKNKNGNDDEFQGLEESEMLQEALRRADAGENAIRIPVLIYDGTNLIYRNPTTPGDWTAKIGSVDGFQLEKDKKYYAVAYATNGSREAYGGIAGPAGTITDNRGFKVTTLNFSNVTTTGAKLFGKFEFDGQHDDTIVEAGFMWAKGSPDGIKSQGTPVTVSSDLLAKLNNYAQYDGDEDAASPNLITNEFSQSVDVTEEEKPEDYYFLAYIKTTSGGKKIFADFTESISSYGNGIIEVRIPGSDELPLPKPVLKEIESDQIQPTLEVRKGHQGGISDLNIYSLKPTIYYMLEEEIPTASLATDDALRGYISNNFDSPSTDVSGKIEYLSTIQVEGSYLDQRVIATFGEAFDNEIHAAEIPELKANATYRAFATVENPSSTANESFGIFTGAAYDGVGASPGINFTTGMNRNNAPDSTPQNASPVYSKPIVDNVIIVETYPDSVELSAWVSNDGGTTITSRKFWYWKTDNDNVTVAQVLANGTPYTDVLANFPMTAKIEDLDNGSNYYVVAQATNSRGTATSKDVTKFNTKGITSNDANFGLTDNFITPSISLDKKNMYFAADGKIRGGTGNTTTFSYLSTYPPKSDFGFRIGQFTFGAQDEIIVNKSKDNLGIDIIEVVVPQNNTGKARKAQIEVYLKEIEAHKDELNIHQDAGTSSNGEGANTGSSSNDPVPQTPAVPPGTNPGTTLPGFQTAG